MRELRQAWVVPTAIRSGDTVPVGRATTLYGDCDTFALRRWDGSPPIPANAVVVVVERRPYGLLLCREVSEREEREVRRFVEDVRLDPRFAALVARFPRPADTVVWQ